MFTLDQRTIDSSGAFLNGQLERFDPMFREPLADVTFTRDISLRTDVTLGDESASFTQSKFLASQSTIGSGYITKATSTVSQVGVDDKKIVQSMHQWSKKASWTVIELASAMQLGRPIDEQKLRALLLDWNMSVDAAMYIGSNKLGTTGLFNNADVSVNDAPTGNWATATADAIVADIREAEERAWTNSAYAVVPTDLRLDPTSFSILNSKKVSDAGNMTVLQYAAINSLCNARNGKPLNIQACKWLTAGQAASEARLVVYSNDPLRVRFPLVPLQRQQPVYQDIAQSVSYIGSHGAVEFLYPETVAYSDGL